jgi:hypothetical protein
MIDPVETTFDVRLLNAALDKAKRRDVAAGGFVVALVLAIVGYLLLTDVPRIALGAISAPQLVIFVIFVVGAVVIVAIAARGAGYKRRGAERITVGRAGLTLHFPNGTTMHSNWSDPHLSFELRDLTRVSRSALSVETPYFILIGKSHSALSREAFEQVLTEVQARGLLDAPGVDPRWLRSSDTIIHVVRGHPN